MPLLNRHGGTLQVLGLQGRPSMGQKKFPQNIPFKREIFLLPFSDGRLERVLFGLRPRDLLEELRAGPTAQAEGEQVLRH